MAQITWPKTLSTRAVASFSAGARYGFRSRLRRRLLLRHRHHYFLPKSHFSSAAAADGPDGSRVKIFDRDLKHRDRAAWAMRETDALAYAVAENVLDRLEDCRKAFPSAAQPAPSAGCSAAAVELRS